MPELLVTLKTHLWADVNLLMNEGFSPAKSRCDALFQGHGLPDEKGSAYSAARTVGGPGVVEERVEGLDVDGGGVDRGVFGVVCGCSGGACR